MDDENRVAGEGVVGVPDAGTSAEVVDVPRRKGGRPKGSKNHKSYMARDDDPRRMYAGDSRLERTSPISVDRVSYDTLTEDERVYVEYRVQGKRPLECMRLMAWKRKERPLPATLEKRARDHEQRLRHLIADWREAQGMTDGVFSAWSERQVINMAQEGTGASKLAALEWLEKRRQERKYGDPDQLRRTLWENLHELDELDRLEAVAEAGGAERVPGVGAPVDAGKQVSEPA